MTRHILRIILPLLMVAPSVAGQVFDPLNQVLGQVGLERETLTFDTDDMSNYGGDEFVLPLFEVLQHRPLKIPYYTDSYTKFLAESGNQMREVISFASLRLAEGSRRALIGSSLDPILAQVRDGVDLYAAIDTLHVRLGIGPNEWRTSATGHLAQVPVELRDIAAVITLAAAEASRWSNLAFAQAEARFALDTMFTRALRFLAWEDDTYDEQFYEFIHWIDWKYLYAGAQDVAAAVDWACDTLSRLNLDKNFEFAVTTALGHIVLNGKGTHQYPADDYLLIIDAAGDDAYTGGAANRAYGRTVNLVFDLEGNDKYMAAADSTVASFGAGIFGYSFLADLDGNDTYLGVNWSQGVGLFGVGCLYDFRGNDTYISHSLAQGSGAFGIGLLYDGGGKDTYKTYLMAQGFGFTKGMGILHDAAGDDTYTADDQDIRYPSSQSKEHNDSMAQGVGFGLRRDYIDGHSLAGGIGMLYDAEGDDRYSAGLFAQGCAYWYAVGILADRSGNDEYSGIWYVQGSGAHFGVGYLNDKAGNDKYTATMNMAIGAGHDFTVGMLIDEAGDDEYQAPNLSLGGGNANGIGFFWDMKGRDKYAVTAATTLGRGNVASRGSLRDSILTLGVFLDTGGEADQYPPEKTFAKNRALWTQPGTNTEAPLAAEKGCGGDF
ncbi:hypothetical protein ACFLQW_02175 [Candidatus Zixiibacteriota bacterium]